MNPYREIAERHEPEPFRCRCGLVCRVLRFVEDLFTEDPRGGWPKWGPPDPCECETKPTDS